MMEKSGFERRGELTLRALGLWLRTAIRYGATSPDELDFYEGFDRIADFDLFLFTFLDSLCLIRYVHVSTYTFASQRHP